MTHHQQLQATGRGAARGKGQGQAPHSAHRSCVQVWHRQRKRLGLRLLLPRVLLLQLGQGLAEREVRGPGIPAAPQVGGSWAGRGAGASRKARARRRLRCRPRAHLCHTLARLRCMPAICFWV